MARSPRGAAAGGRTPSEGSAGAPCGKRLRQHPDQRRAISVALELGEPGRVLDLPGDNQHLLIQVNLAEAEYNLGRWEAAEARIRGALAACEPFDLTRGGARIQLAWILANTGRSEEAIRLCETVELEWFPDIYRAEPCFTSALALLGLGRLDEAQTDAECGRDLSMRPSSERNAQFILARVARARGDLVTAEALCREAAGREYRGQGGDGLLLWGDLLSELDRAGEARAAWALAVERDPESESAAHAARRLASASEA
jgi:tetratricopeptide (TPR) repeat protein